MNKEERKDFFNGYNLVFNEAKSNLKKKDQLAWKIAEIASDKAKLNNEAVDMIINRIIDNASVAIASFNRKPVISAREMALALSLIHI